jgi:ABC-type glycerol-3-phosphate transport system substrate-binding protein
MKKILAFLRAHILPVIAIVVVALGAVVYTSAHNQVSAKPGRTKIVFWNEMGGPAEVALDQMVDKFNKSQTKYEVIPQYQGAYDEAVQKIIQSHGSSASPALFTTTSAIFLRLPGHSILIRANNWPCRSIRRSRFCTITRRCLKNITLPHRLNHQAIAM